MAEATRSRFGGRILGEEQQQSSFGGRILGPSEGADTLPMTMATAEDWRQIDPPGEITRNMSPWDAFREKFREGGQTLGRGLGLPGRGFDEPDAYQQYRSGVIQREFPISSTVGNIAGEMAPLAPAATSVGALPFTSARVLGSGAVGAIEGYGATRGRGKNVQESALVGATSMGVASALELLLPHFGRAAGAIYRRVRGTAPKGALLTAGGAPTPDFQQALSEAGLSIDDFHEQALSFLRAAEPGSDPQQALRRARFDELDMESSKGDVTQDFRQQASEARLASMTGPPEGEELRALRARQSDQFRGGIEAMVDTLGAPDRVGEQVKMALTGRLKLLNEQRSTIYREIAENSPHAAQMPVLTEGIVDALPDPQVYETLFNKAPDKVKQFEDLMIQYGIDQDPERVEAFINSGRRTQREIFPLNLSNFDNFRQELNRLYDDTTPEGRDVWARMVRPVITALDDETKIISDTLERADVGDINVFKELQRARGLVQEIKREYNPDDLAARLIKPKSSGDRVLSKPGEIPMTEPSQVFGVLMRPSTAPEALGRTVDLLLRSGEQGRAAMGDLQATVLMDALDQAFKAASVRENGRIQAVYSNFYKQLDKLDKAGKLEIFFKDNPTALRRIRMFQQAALDLTTNSRAAPKGSGPVNMDMAFSLFNYINNSRLTNFLRNSANVTVNAGAGRREASQAARNLPEVEQFRNLLQEQYPSLGAFLAAGGTAAYMNEENQ